MAYSPIDKPNTQFSPLLYTGNSSNGHEINGLDFQPDFVWIKSRNQADFDHMLFDSVRASTTAQPFDLRSNKNNLESTDTSGLVSFDSDGFTLNSGGYVNTGSFASWNWKKSATSGFDIVTATGTGSAKTIAHSLSAVPQVIISKERSGSVNDWVMYHESLGNNKKMILNETNAVGTDSCWNNTTPTSSVFSVSGASVVNRNSSTYVYYLFSEKKGYSKFGSYDSNSNANGPFVYLGFKPALVIVKCTTAAESWGLVDSKRAPINLTSVAVLNANTNGTEGGAEIDLLSNGFKLTAVSGQFNKSGSHSYIYMAFAENPLVASNYVPTTAR